MKFDVAGSIPAGAHIDSVTLKVHVAKDLGITSDFEVHPLQASWGEGTSDAGTAKPGNGTFAATNDATWSDRFFGAAPPKPWASAGGDFSSTASATTSLGGVGFYQFSDPKLTADVQAWMNSPSTQFGWMIKAHFEDAAHAGTAQELDSRESPTPANRPTLTINFTSGPNQQPTLTAINDPAAILEDAAQQTVDLSGITAGNAETQNLAVTATSSNPALIPDPTVVYTSPNSTGSLRYTPVANQSGSAVITVTVKDDGGTANGGIDIITRSFTVNVTPVNDPPTLNSINDPPAISEDVGQQTINFGGITAGPNETQVLSVSAASNNPTLITNLAVSYTSPNAAGSLTYTPTANRSGSAIITVTVKDNGGTASGGNDTVTRSFTVNVTAVNDPPTLTAIASPTAILEDAAQQTIDLQGISSGVLEFQNLVVSATTDNPTLLPDLAVDYSSPSSTGALTYTPAANRSGSATITVTVKDDGGTASGGVDTITRSFSVSVTPVNDAPTLNPIDDPTAIIENAGQQTINLSGITAGPLESQTLHITATSSNTTLIPDPAVSYISPNSTGSLTYTPAAGQNGSAVITVTVKDDGGTASGGVDTITRTFNVQVNPASFVNQPPSFAKGPDESSTDEDGPLSFAGWATSISPGPPSESAQTVSFSVTNLNNALFKTQPNIEPGGKLTFTPAPNAHGTTIVTVRLKDNGGTTNGGNDTSPPQTFNITIIKPHQWHNSKPWPLAGGKTGLDVNDDNHVVPADALAVINYVNNFGTLNNGKVPDVGSTFPTSPPQTVTFGGPFGFLDVSGDGFVVPADALLVINVVNANQGGEGESPGDLAPLDSFYSALGSPPATVPASADLLALLLMTSDQSTGKPRR